MSDFKKNVKITIPNSILLFPINKRYRETSFISWRQIKNSRDQSTRDSFLPIIVKC